jgi:hypothetical protein
MSTEYENRPNPTTPRVDSFEAWTRRKAEYESAMLVIDAPHADAGEDPITAAELDAAYRSLNAWRGDSWLAENPRKPTPAARNLGEGSASGVDRAVEERVATEALGHLRRLAEFAGR